MAVITTGEIADRARKFFPMLTADSHNATVTIATLTAMIVMVNNARVKPKSLQTLADDTADFLVKVDAFLRANK